MFSLLSIVIRRGKASKLVSDAEKTVSDRVNKKSQQEFTILKASEMNLTEVRQKDMVLSEN